MSNFESRHRSNHSRRRPPASWPSSLSNTMYNLDFHSSADFLWSSLFYAFNKIVIHEQNRVKSSRFLVWTESWMNHQKFGFVKHWLPYHRDYSFPWFYPALGGRNDVLHRSPKFWYAFICYPLIVFDFI